ncbi:MAG: asparagine synthase (glutamine-hydrolyzing) [Elusimicrobia bacterium]|nr:asparagine synthase (glutamine-hydrolyzing) [Elusimicrobiota bacterium]
MCGICGIYNFDGRPADQALLKRMCDLMRHRGPDAEGLYLNGSIGLGMRRLSIIDLKTGDQPVYNEDKNLAVVMNGEIYNYIELRRTLLEKGHRFSTTSDTEVIIHLFEEYGEASFAMLNGFFAFSIYNSRTRELYVVRDRWGIKPLYFSSEGSGLVFGSEIKVFKALNRSFALDHAALWDYFSYGYLPAAETMLAGVTLLAQGCYFKVSASGAAAVKRYHQFERKPEWANLSPEDAREIFFKKAENAVKISLRSDVPVGLFLSGGLDSNILLYEARKHMPGLISSYTVGFEGSSFDESALVRKLADEYRLKATFLTLTPDWIKANFSRISCFHDSLAVTPSLLPLELLSETAAKSLKVALSGSGGDELMLGYPTYQADILWRWFSRLPAVVKKAFAASAELVPHQPGRLPLDYKLKKFAEGLFFHFEKAHYSWRTILSEREKDSLLSPDIFPTPRRDSAQAYEQAFAEAPQSWHPLDRASFADIHVWLSNMGHLQSDTFTMCNSLEMRPPLLENELAEFLFSLPREFKMRGMTTKGFFRYCYKDKIPPYILSQRKMGFHVPLAQWFRGELKDFASGYLFSGGNANRYFRREELESIFREHLDLGADNSFKIFSIICFLEWTKQYKGMVKL